MKNGTIRFALHFDLCDRRILVLRFGADGEAFSAVVECSVDESTANGFGCWGVDAFGGDAEIFLTKLLVVWDVADGDNAVGFELRNQRLECIWLMSADVLQIK